MNPRIRRIITAASPSHLLLLLLLLTSQLPAQTGGQNLQVNNNQGNAAAPADEVTIKASEQVKRGNIYELTGDVEIDYHGYVLRADKVTYDSDTGAALASGSVVLDGGPQDAHLQAARANYNVKQESGTFYDVVGSFGTVVRGRTIVLTTNNPFMVTGREVRKVGDRYIVSHGTITSCALPSPKWEFEGEKIDVVAGEEARIYHATFRLRHIPVIYFPYIQHPVQNLGRQSGFLIPAVGQSSSKGFIFGDSFYWVIDRSMDATVGAEYWSRRGWSERADFRARPTDSSSFNVRLFSVQDRGNPSNGQDQGGEEVWVNGELNRGNWRAVASVDYLSSYIFRQAFSETYSQAVNSEVISTGFITRNQNGYSLNAMAERYQNFQTSGGSSVKIVHEPTLEATGVDRNLANTPFTWGFDSAIDVLARNEPNFNTDSAVARVDLYPHLALPLSWNGWDLRSEVAVRNTFYSQSQNWPPYSPSGVPRDATLNRGTVEGTVEFRPPALAKVFEGEVHGRKLKHVIEPRVTYHYVTGVNQFQQTIRFDERDILTDTNELEYGITQRVYARRRESRPDPRCQEQAQEQTNVRPGQYLPGTSAQPVHCEAPGANTREILRWELKQRYYANPTFGGAVITGQRNVFTSTDELTGIAFLTEPRRFSPIVSRLRVLATANTDIEWELDYDTKKGRINASTALVDYRVGPVFFGASEAFLRVPEEVNSSTASSGPTVFNQYRGLVGFGHPNKRGWSGGFSLGYDQHFDYLQYGAVQTTYNWDCCGLNIEYRRFAFPGVRNENLYRFTLTLANFGTFGNLRRSERLY
ncbi:MAG TPA: LPS assembly protein LptD [Candidatus Acidoferrales bacterium]|nr:LPS assembly protein LptD [Candidatus Acidoferrales bacterium]